MRYLEFLVKLITNSSPSISISAAQNIIGVTVAALFNVGLLFLGFTSIGGAILPGCPFRSAFSDMIRFIFEKPPTLLKWILHERLSLEWNRRLWIAILKILFLVLGVASIILTNNALIAATGICASLFIVTSISFPLAFFARSEAVHNPQKYKIPHLALGIFLPHSVIFIIGYYFSGVSDGKQSLIWWLISLFGELITVSAVVLYVQMSKSMADTGEIDAVAWLLKTAPPQNPATFFKKAGQMTGSDSIGCHYRSRLLESLIPFLSLLITSHHAPENPSSESDTHSPSSCLSVPADFDEDQHLKNLEIYTACLARLSEFTDSKGSFKCLWENAMQHPKLEQPLVDKLVLFANLDPQNRFQELLRSAATTVLINYRMDTKGKSARGPDTIVRRNGVTTVLRNGVSSVGTFFGSAALWMLNVSGLKKEQGRPDFHKPVELEHVELPHLSGDIEEA